MRWEFGRRSRNIEDRRGMRVGGPVVGGGLGAILLAVIVTLLGGDPGVILEQVSSQQGGQSDPNFQASSPEEEQLADFTSTVLASTEDTWSELFRQAGATYREPKLVLFSGRVDSACGRAEAAMGPFYCPLDQKVYIDLSFYRDLKTRHNAPGDFAQAYVVAHEIGHHVQKLLGISDQVQRLQQQSSKTQANQLSVLLELQADCFAGVWARYADESGQIPLEPGDIEEGLNAASAIGDDRLQMEARGYVVPDAFTHGSSAQRVRWFKQGIQTGDPDQCNTFEAQRL
ncbi:MAG: flagellar biosynthesis protein FlgM [Cyanobacteria bacterium RM1_2_2]|nr:flagellar biosynthesis protein FlgM [Cyanobacteria bacterium RM1_2_2]